MNEEFAKSSWPLWAVPAAMLILAPPIEWPYAYYMLLRIVVCGASGVLAFMEYGRLGRPTLWMVCFALLALAFNPIFRVTMGRDEWAPIDYLAGAFYLAHLAVTWRRKQAS